MSTRLHDGFGLCAVAVFAACTLLPAKAEWFVEVGPVYRGHMKISVDGGSHAGDSGGIPERSGTGGGGTSATPGAPLNDDGSSAMFRQFDDGYVGPSGWEWAREDGVTQFFGYDNPEQYDADAYTLTYQLSLGSTSVVGSRTTTRVRESLEPSGWKDSKRVDGAGLMATLGYRFRNADEQDRSSEWIALLRFGWLDGMGAKFRNRPAFRQDVEMSTYATTASSEETYAYTYDTLGNPVFPAAPYAMEDAGGVGPMIADTPTSITPTSQSTAQAETLVRRSSYSAHSLVNLDVDVHAFTFQAGPRLHWHPAAAVSLYLQSTLTLNLIDVSARRAERFQRTDGNTIATWTDREDERTWRMGANLYIGAQMALSESWYVSVAGGYEWVDSNRLTIGPDRIRIDLSGYQGEVALGFVF